MKYKSINFKVVDFDNAEQIVFENISENQKEAIYNKYEQNYLK